MTIPKWHFDERRPGDRARDPKNDAFFTAESLETISEGLVREGIQNSLDAARRGSGGEREIRVRIAFVQKAPEETRKYLRALFETAQTHFENGLDSVSFDELFGPDCGYLVFEDFGTKGLTGDIAEWRLGHVEQNAFFSFFRAEGRSAKQGEKLGRWGIGKQVFPTSSRLHAVLGLTVRTDDLPSRVFMGSAVLRNHSAGEKDYQPDGWFGLRESENGLVRPVEDAAFIDEISQKFGLQRGNNPGLSIIVPATDERLSADDIRRGIVRSFFWPILSGELVVEFESVEGTIRIDAESLPAQRALLPPAEAAAIEFAAWASVAKPNEIVALSEAAAIKPDWRTTAETLLPEDKLAEIRKQLDQNQRIGVRIPVRVRPKPSGRKEPETQQSHFTVFIESCRDAGHKPIFLRDGIVITDVRGPGTSSGNRSLVVIDDPPLAGLLGDAEGVNHTQWQKDSPKFHGKYVHGPDTIKFVARSVYEILQRLHATETKGDPTLLMDLFFLPSDGAPSPGPGKKTPPPGAPPPPETPPDPHPKKFDLRRADGGFLLRAGPSPFTAFPVRVRIEAGYAVRRGNPISRWAADDFVFTRAPLRHDPKPEGVSIAREDGNVIELEIKKPDFTFGVTGFDKKRDVVVHCVELKGDGDETDV